VLEQGRQEVGALFGPSVVMLMAEGDLHTASSVVVRRDSDAVTDFDGTKFMAVLSIME